jgi:hypothetical protein
MLQVLAVEMLLSRLVGPSVLLLASLPLKRCQYYNAVEAVRDVQVLHHTVRMR